MESFVSRYRNPLVLLAVVLAQLIGLAVQVRRPAADGDGRQVHLIRYWGVTLVSPFERAFLFTGHGIRNIWSGYIDLHGVRQQNRQLHAELDRMRLDQAALAEDARQGVRLQKLLNFRQSYIVQTVPAEVIGTSGSEQAHVLNLNKGSADGIRADMPVITADGVVGKVRDVFPHTSQVLEINDQTSGLGVILSKTRLRGILRGNTAGQTEIIDILPDERIEAGEPVVTSGGDQVYPRGLAVGVVERVVNDPSRNPYVAVLVKPAVNLARLDEVLVITQTGSTMPASMQDDVTTSEEKAADILAQRLPGAQLAPAAANGANAPPQNPNAPPPPVQPPQPLHPDRFTPDATPPAADLTPGAAYPKQVFPAQPQPAVANPVKKVPDASSVKAPTSAAAKSLKQAPATESKASPKISPEVGSKIDSSKSLPSSAEKPETAGSQPKTATEPQP